MICVDLHAIILLTYQWKQNRKFK